MTHAGWPSNLRTQETYPVRITKTVRTWLLDNGHDSLAPLLADAPHRADGAAQVVLTLTQLRELWWAMEDMLEEMYDRRYTPGVNSAVGMQRKAEAYRPSLPW